MSLLATVLRRENGVEIKGDLSNGVHPIPNMQI